MNYLYQGKNDSAVVEAQLELTEVWQLHAMALTYYAAGRRQEADQALKELIRKYQDQGPFQIAEVYSYRGEIDQAFEWLETAYKLRDGGVSQIMGDPRFKKIESDPRFAVFLRKLKLTN
jgi:tetratricopeptide (TPR) repeat protein